MKCVVAADRARSAIMQKNEGNKLFAVGDLEAAVKAYGLGFAYIYVSDAEWHGLTNEDRALVHSAKAR